jgi:hypothetical protein
MRANRNEYSWHPSVLGAHYIDHVTRSASSDPLLITKSEGIPTWMIVAGIVVVAVLVFGKVFI